MKDKIIKLFKSQTVLSLFYLALGLCLVIMPVTMVNVICKIVFGVVLIAAGIFHIIIYVNGKKNATLLDLFSGVLVLVLGGFLFFNPQVVVKLLPVLLGVFVMVDTIWVLQGCLNLKKQKRQEWKEFTLVSIVFIILSIVLVVNPFNTVKVTIIFGGIVLLCNGIVDIVFLIFQKRKPKEHSIDSSSKSELAEENVQPEEQIKKNEAQNVNVENTEKKEENIEPLIQDEKNSYIEATTEKENNDNLKNYDLTEKEEEKASLEEEPLEEWKD